MVCALTPHDVRHLALSQILHGLIVLVTFCLMIQSSTITIMRTAKIVTMVATQVCDASYHICMPNYSVL